ncbi:hypothetical protein ACFU8Q_39400, partial [Streptomyces sp. NPDC057543]|uniref:hypothetical protein n=1 Tax=Streptomyces sp. NPDC057543 TaxID=3346163 RepID=UPI00368D8AF4
LPPGRGERPSLVCPGVVCGRGLDTSAVRLVSPADRMRVQRGFQPTTPAVRARPAAENAEGAAYADAVSEYAALGRDGLRGGGPRGRPGYFGSRLKADFDQK